MVKNILSAKVEQVKVLSKKLLEDFLVQDWVAVLIIGVKEEFAESTQLAGKVT